jgi:hypothetical protein
VLLPLIAVVIVLWLLIIYRNKCIAMLERFSKFSHMDKVKALVHNLISAVSFLKNRQVLLKSAPITLGAWTVLYGLTVYFNLKAMGINISYGSALVVMSVSVLSAAIPSSPGFVGTWEFFCMLALSIFNIDRNRALSYALVSHFMAFLPIIVIGLYFFITETITPSRFRETGWGNK